ncbi:MAG: Dipeptide transport system permease protein DppB, partial [uncultured Thermomicrobiales bacterium]
AAIRRQPVVLVRANPARDGRDHVRDHVRHARQPVRPGRRQPDQRGRDPPTRREVRARQAGLPTIRDLRLERGPRRLRHLLRQSAPNRRVHHRPHLPQVARTGAVGDPLRRGRRGLARGLGGGQPKRRPGLRLGHGRDPLLFDAQLRDGLSPDPALCRLSTKPRDQFGLQHRRLGRPDRPRPADDRPRRGAPGDAGPLHPLLDDRRDPLRLRPNRPRQGVGRAGRDPQARPQERPDPGDHPGRADLRRRRHRLVLRRAGLQRAGDGQVLRHLDAVPGPDDDLGRGPDLRRLLGRDEPDRRSRLRHDRPPDPLL